MAKIILLLHGWPQYRLENYFLNKHFENKGYKVVCPDLFDKRFEFSIPNLIHKIQSVLGNNKPDGIVGISMGGLVAPYFASLYPESKLIFVASAANLRSKSKIFNFFLKLAQKSLSVIFFKAMLRLPNDLLEKVYRLINPFMGSHTDKEAYIEDTKANVEFIKSIPIEKEKEIIKFVISVDNRPLLKGVQNKSLIFSGAGDRLMPLEKGQELHRLLQNSRLVIKRGEHFNVFGEKDLETVDAFLQS